MRRGLFISFEGPDASGKSTQSRLLHAYLRDEGYQALLLREPGGTSIGEQIRRVILDNDNAEMDYMAEAMLYAAARAQLVAQVIRPALADGKIVICDRFSDSSTAYQGGGRGLGEAVGIINAYAAGDCVPDATFLLRVPPCVSEERLRRRPNDRMENEGPEYHKAVYDAYTALEGRYPERITGVDGTRSESEVSSALILRVERLLRDAAMIRRDQLR